MNSVVKTAADAHRLASLGQKRYFQKLMQEIDATARKGQTSLTVNPPSDNERFLAELKLALSKRGFVATDIREFGYASPYENGLVIPPRFIGLIISWEKA